MNKKKKVVNITKKWFLIIGLILMFVGACATTSYYVFDFNPTLRLVSRSRNRVGITSLYFVVSNPTNERKHFILECSHKEDTWVVIRKKAIVAPRSDLQVIVSSSIGGEYRCQLIKDETPGSQAVE